MGSSTARPKSWLRGWLQSSLGLERYLDLFARYKVATLGWSPQGADFLAFLRLVPDDGVVLDVGANVGFTTVALARRAGRGVVHAFEPSPVAFGALERTISRHRLRNVVTHPLALGSADGTIEMVTPIDGASRLPALSHVVSGSASAVGERFVAPCRTLDGAVDWASGPRVTAMKIDVEDHEYHVLVGGRRLIAAHRPLVFCELWETENRSRSLALARELGYEVRVREGGTLVPFDPGRHRVLDFYFLPVEAARA